LIDRVARLSAGGAASAALHARVRFEANALCDSLKRLVERHAPVRLHPIVGCRPDVRWRPADGRRPGDEQRDSDEQPGTTVMHGVPLLPAVLQSRWSLDYVRRSTWPSS